MQAWLARRKALPVGLKKHWRKILLFITLSLSWKIVAFMYRHHIMDFFINLWSWWSNMNFWLRWSVYSGICLAIGFWCFIRGAALVSQDEESK